MVNDGSFVIESSNTPLVCHSWNCVCDPSILRYLVTKLVPVHPAENHFWKTYKFAFP